MKRFILGITTVIIVLLASGCDSSLTAKEQGYSVVDKVADAVGSVADWGASLGDSSLVDLGEDAPIDLVVSNGTVLMINPPFVLFDVTIRSNTQTELGTYYLEVKGSRVRTIEINDIGFEKTLEIDVGGQVASNIIAPIRKKYDDNVRSIQQKIDRFDEDQENKFTKWYWDGGSTPSMTQIRKWEEERAALVQAKEDARMESGVAVPTRLLLEHLSFIVSRYDEQ